MKNNLIIAIVIALVIGGASGFLAGMHYQNTQRLSLSGTNGYMMNRQGYGAGQFRNGGMRPVVGEITNKDATSITVKLQDGSSKIVLVSDKTPVNKEATASAADLQTGEKIAVFGTTNADGSVTAQAVQLNPLTRMFGRPSGAPQQ
ncbi:MAG TPA: DUF5666 domain-containing protein [Patescibacteria group bacterium]